MFAFLLNFFQKKGIELVAPIRLRDCKIQKPYLLERAEIESGTVFMLAVPYFTTACLSPCRNISAYAVSRDYHMFFEETFGELLPMLKERYPNGRFACFADHSPIAEADAAARAGLGVIGKNGLLITEKYSSYIFLGEIITSYEEKSIPAPKQKQECESCGKCQKACPMTVSGGICLSALTQKKGSLTEEEIATLCRYGSVWGCDICQEVCPHTQKAKESGSILSPVPFFSEKNVAHLTSSILNGMTSTEFSQRAYAWRGRDTVERNLRLIEKNTEKC